VNRRDFQELARVRLDEANALLQAGYFDGAYYLAGYAVECALKACIAKLTKQFDFPPDRHSIENMYTHDLTKLVKAAELWVDLSYELTIDKAFELNWSIAKEWSELKRYVRISEAAAIALYDALTDRRHGVMRWLRLHW
jgi:HEPN domain-containing protein